MPGYKYVQHQIFLQEGGFFQVNSGHLGTYLHYFFNESPKVGGTMALSLCPPLITHTGF